MIDVEKLLREGKTSDEILQMLTKDIEEANLKFEKEKEAKKVEALKQEQLKDACAKAAAALQAVYDLSDGCISVVVRNGKVKVNTNDSSYKIDTFTNRKNSKSILDDILYFWNN